MTTQALSSQTFQQAETSFHRQLKINKEKRRLNFQKSHSENCMEQR